MTPPLLLPTNAIIIHDRVRKADSPEVAEHILNLRLSLRRFGGHPSGLLQPVLVDENSVLLAGWCRYSACVAEGWPTIPCYSRTSLAEAEYREIELEENFRRLGFTWQEEVQSVCDIHKLHVHRALAAGTSWTQQMTGDLLGGYSDSYISNCLRVRSKLTLPEYAHCESLTDAVRVWYREKEDLGMAELAKRTALNRATAPKLDVTDQSCIACEGTGTNSKGGVCTPCGGTGFKLKLADIVIPTPPVDDIFAHLLTPGVSNIPEEVIDLSNTLFLGDSVRSLLPSWPADCVDHIITDSPYAIDVANLQQASTALMDTSRVDATHNVEENLELFVLMMPNFYRILKPGGFFITWCDSMHFRLLHDLALASNFSVQRWPLLWLKTSPCKNQMAHCNFTKDYEIAIVCRKGTARLPSPVNTSRIVCPNDAEKASNPFAKPFLAWKFLIEAVSIPGQTILEPFAGEGSAVVAGLKLNRRMLAVEKDEQHFNYLIEAVKTYWQGVFRKVRFV